MSETTPIFDPGFFCGKKIFITGHTGFKGSWLCQMLLLAGADITGYALPPEGPENLYTITKLEQDIHSILADIRDFDKLQKAIQTAKPDILFHLAAQPLVSEGFNHPRETYETNVMGTVNVLEALRYTPVRSSLIITTDKVYENREWLWGYRENERLNGTDPYSNSKSCAELLTWSYQKAFFNRHTPDQPITAISTARAGNVIGGGDFAPNRIIPDCVRAARNHQIIAVRHPHSIRPYQHVLEALDAYLQIAAYQYCDPTYADSYNVGPDEQDCLTTRQLVEYFCQSWGEGLTWQDVSQNDAILEANYLKLDCTKLKQRLTWQPHWDAQTAVQKTIDWTKDYLAGKDMKNCMQTQIKDYWTERKEP